MDERAAKAGIETSVLLFTVDTPKLRGAVEKAEAVAMRDSAAIAIFILTLIDLNWRIKSGKIDARSFLRKTKN